MSIEKLLDHKCNIYHLRKTQKSPGFGLPPSEAFDYPEKPDEKEIICHFGIESLDTRTEQKNPQNVLQEKIKLTLPIGTDIRINDKIVDCESGLEYMAERPKPVRNHHIFVYIKRTKEQEALGWLKQTK